MRNYSFWIDGKFEAFADAKLIDRHSPVNGQIISRCIAGTGDDVARAVSAAKAAFDRGDWQALPGSERGKILNRLADLIDQNQDRLARIESEEVGKPLAAALGEVAFASELTRAAAAQAWNLPGKAVSDAGPDVLALALHEPRGCVGLILPWNYPLYCLMMKLPSALAAGCSVVVKPSEFTPGTTLAIAELASEAGLPAGQLNVVTGTGAIVGSALVNHPDVVMISFTGSTAIGRQIAVGCAARFAKYTLEMGGKGANIVFADANLDAAVEGVLLGFTANAGEECCAGTRILVEASIASEFKARLVTAAKALVAGPLNEEGTQLGPLIHPGHLEKVESYVARGKAEGAKLILGGERLSDGAFADGLYFAPTLFDDVTPEMTIFREEIFGPVAGITEFETTEQAITLANASAYGLANGVWTSNLDRALMLSRKLRSGNVWINTYLHALPQLAFGGLKESGVGRENGLEGILEYMDIKSTVIKSAPSVA